MLKCFCKPLNVPMQQTSGSKKLYFNQFFYLPSNTTRIAFFILFALMFFTTVFIGILMTIFNKQELKVPEDLQSLSQQFIWITVFISPVVIYNIMTRTLNCIIHLDKMFGDYCHPKLNLAEAIIWIIIKMAIIFMNLSFIFRMNHLHRVKMFQSSLNHFMHHFFVKKSFNRALNNTQHMHSSYKIIYLQCNLNYLHTYRKHVNVILDGHHYGLFYRLMKYAEESMKSGKIDEQIRTQSNQLVSKSANDGSIMMDSKQHSINIQLQQADKQYEISKVHLTGFWSLLTRGSVDVDKVEHHIRITSQNARLAQEQYNTLLIAHSENPNNIRQYSVLMIDMN
ncbi:MAG: hypothetical protein EZS28_025918 [Streblomastix strix]|uniref:TmcB/TmcC TPR repeats domain-containing protein n=1 Tax=Streblomastix strix TaxID=222440 RepID=A0A5J4V7S5_9EUKA|nr:MAG: hypothetical protein EZS28_025918 [Streblomastix strix]